MWLFMLYHQFGYGFVSNDIYNNGAWFYQASYIEFFKIASMDQSRNENPHGLNKYHIICVWYFIWFEIGSHINDFW